MQFLRLALLALFTVLSTTGCESTRYEGIHSTSRAVMLRSIENEPPGNYFIGRRYFKNHYKFWGYIRKPGEAWGTAKLVMLNEQQKLAPDRAIGKIGSDNNYEYKLLGYFSGETVYEPSSNGFYPEFVLRAYELRSANPAPIFRDSAATDPSRRVLGRPY